MHILYKQHQLQVSKPLQVNRRRWEEILQMLL